MLDSSAPVDYRRLVSLGDIMRRFHVRAYAQLANFFGHVVGGVSATDRVLNVVYPEVGSSAPQVLSEKLLRDLSALLSLFEPSCVDLGMACSCATIRKIIAATSGPEPSSAMLPLMEELQGRLEDEMQARIFFALDLKESEYYRDLPKEWVPIVERFEECFGDVEEACKCFALSRYPGAVFHSLQIVEHGLIELGAFIGVTDPLSGWTAVANRLQHIVSKKHPERTTFERANFAFVEQVQATVEALKNAWRNKVSHAHGKLTLLTADMNPEIAEEILFATRAFMRRLADGLPATPLPGTP